MLLLILKEIERDLLAVALKKRVIELRKTGVIHSFGIKGGKTMKNCKKHTKNTFFDWFTCFSRAICSNHEQINDVPLLKRNQE